MDDHDFIFSLYSGDVIRIVSEKDISLSRVQDEADFEEQIQQKDILCYYAAADINSGRIKGFTHDKAYQFRTGIKKLKNIEKYTVDILGRYHKVNHEVRKGFAGIKRN